MVNFRLAVVCALVKGSSCGVGAGDGAESLRLEELGEFSNCRLRGWGFPR